MERPRALGLLAQTSVEDRLDTIAEGLRLIAEHVSTLGDDIQLLAKAERHRGAAVLEAVSEEEAAKALILLDLVRIDDRRSDLLARQLKRFYSHLARCIYVEVTHMAPADMAEVKRIVDSARQSHYLDGPYD